MQIKSLVKYVSSQLKHFYACAYMAVFVALLSGCSNTRYLPEGESLYIGAEVKVEDNGTMTKKENKRLAKHLKEITKPEPNETLFGFLRPKLWIYNIVGKPKKEKGLRSFIRNKLGEPPVLFSDVNLERNRELLRNRLENKGHFHPQVTFESKQTSKRRIKVFYTANILQAYKINNVNWPKHVDSLTYYINLSKENTLLKSGDNYDLETIKAERERINTYLKDKGFFYFSPEYLIVRVDSAIGNRTADFNIHVKENVPDKGKRIYTLRKIYIYPNFSIAADTTEVKMLDTFMRGNYVFVQSGENMFRARALARSIFMRRGDVYRYSDNLTTLSRLMSMGTFKYVNTKYNEIDSTGRGQLDAHIYLTPLPKRTLRTELRGVSKSNNFVGPELSISLRNRNFLRGAELLTININGGWETLVGGQQSGVNSWTVGAETRLDLPRFLTPFRVRNYKSQEVPHTQFRLGFELLSRVQYFDMGSLNFSYGYLWKETRRKQHELMPVVISFLTVTRTTPLFDELLAKNISLQRSFQKQFILGSTYSYTYNTQVDAGRKHDFYFNGTGDISGNIFYLLQSFTKKEKPTDENPYEVLKTPFSQYARASTDFRYYFNINNEHKIVTRLFSGAGFAYGNSTIMPYVKQFFIGGNNSVRAFQIRTLGPGSYRPADQDKSFIVNQAGDIRLEGNLEYRYPIYGIFKGAVFTDAGNIWLTKADSLRPGAEFKSDRFMKEFAVGVGTGLRIDASFFVIRFDLAFPVRKPYLPENNRWVFTEIKPGDPMWRKENLVLNIAIGYPF